MRLVVALMLLAATVPGSAWAQSVRVEASAGPSWRATRGALGVRQDLLDALTIDLAVRRTLGSGLALRVGAGATLGTGVDAIPELPGCPIEVLCSVAASGHPTVPGTIVRGRVGLAWVPGALGERLEIRADAGAFGASVSGPDAVAGLSAGGSLRLVRWLDVGAEATRLLRRLGEVQWLVTPTLRIRL